MVNKEHSFDAIEIRGNDEKQVRGLLRLLPEDTFDFARVFAKGLPGLGEQFCGQIGIYARSNPLVGNNGVMLVAVNEHLFGDSTSSEDNPVFRIPDGAGNVVLYPARMPPLKDSFPFVGVTFNYNGNGYFFGYELSKTACKVIGENYSASLAC